MDDMGDGNGILGPGMGAGMGGNMGGGMGGNMGGGMGGGGGGNLGMGNWGMGGGNMGGGMGVGNLGMGAGMGMGNMGGGNMGMGAMMGSMATSPIANVMGGVTAGAVGSNSIQGVNPQVLQQIGIDPNCVTDQVFVANVSVTIRVQGSYRSPNVLEFQNFIYVPLNILELIGVLNFLN